MLIDIEVNNKVIKARKEETILAALRRNGLHVPTLCSMEKLQPTGACRMCVVEVEGMEGLVPACSYPINGWMRIKTHSPRVVTARKTIVELLLSNHPDDCLYCIRNGNCELQHLAEELNVHERRFFGSKKKQKIDNSSPAIVRDPDKCILCGRCVRYCDEVLGIAAIEFIRRGTNANIGPEFNKGINTSTCINCGQCVMQCPTGALHEKACHNKVREALHHKDKHVIAITDSTAVVSLGEEFGMKPGKNMSGILNAALRLIGFDAIFDTAFGADLYVTELASTIISNKKKGTKTPVVSNHCSGWVKHVDLQLPQYAPWHTPIIPPQQQLGHILKSYYAEKKGVDPKNIVVVSINGCTAKKEEITRKEYVNKGLPNIDISLTTREAADFIKLHGIETEQIEEELTDLPFGMASSGGHLHTLSGGLIESLVRSLFLTINERELRPARVSWIRNTKTVKEYSIKYGKKSIELLAVSGVKEASKVLKEVEQGKRKVDFIEVLACDQGCIAGGGQPLRRPSDNVKARRKAIYEIENKGSIKVAEKNPEIEDLNKRFLGEAGSTQRRKWLYSNILKQEE